MSSNCRLCGQLNSVDSTEKYCLFEENGDSSSIGKIVLQHYNIEIRFDKKCNQICSRCWRITGDFHDLYEAVLAADANMSAFEEHDDHFADNDMDWPADDQSVIPNNSDEKLIPESDFKTEPKEIPVECNLSECEPLTNDIKDEVLEPTVPKRKRGRPSKYSIPEIKKENPPKKSATKDESSDLQDQQIRDFFKMSCDICKINFQTMREAIQHYRQSHNQAGYLMCCDKKFYRRCKALDHIQMHINPNLLQCNKCDKTYSTKFGLSNHLLEHEGAPLKPHICHVCASSFVKKFQLTQHLRVRHLDQTNKPFGCDICGKFFVTKYVLSAHMKTVHENAYSQMCHICAKTFKSKKVYELHQFEHLDHEIPKLQCNICGSWLKHEDSLRKHLARHTETEMLCKICNKMYPSKTAHGNHVRYVHSARSYKCTLCDKAFKKPIGLKEHMALHTGVDLYRCPYCPRTFKSGANMHSHRKKEHFALWTQHRQQRLSTKMTESDQFLNLA